MLSLRMKSLTTTIQMKPTEQYFSVVTVVFIVLRRVVPNFQSADEILNSDHSYKTYWAVLPYDDVYYAVQGVCSYCARVC